MRARLLRAFAHCVFLFATASFPAQGQAQGLIRFEIDERRADLAITLLAQQADVSVLFPAQTLERIEVNPVLGRYTLEDALRIMLAGTTLTASIAETGHLVLRFDESRGRAERPASFPSAGNASVDPKVSEAGAVRERLRVIEEVTVTARRRDEVLNEVPISMAVYDGDTLRRGGFAVLVDFSTFVPNLKIDDGLVGQRLVIRGIGTATENEAFEQAVAQFHDGVYYGRDNLGRNALFDLERIEVVRGPQPIFAGQSTVAGALNTVSRRPGKASEANVLLSYGADRERDLQFGIGGPVSAAFGLRVAGRRYLLGETGYTQVTTGEPVGRRENTALRVTGVWTPSESFELVAKYEHHEVQQFGTPREFTRCEVRPRYSVAHPIIGEGLPAMCAVDAAYNDMDLSTTTGSIGLGGTQDIYAALRALNAASGAVPGDSDYWPGVGTSPVAQDLDSVSAFSNAEAREHESDVLLVSFDRAFGPYTLSSITSRLEYDKRDWLDPDSSSFALVTDQRLERFEQTAQELRLSSPSDGVFSWMLGAYWQTHDLDTAIYTFLPVPLVGPPGTRAVSFGGRLVESSKWTSVFFSGSWNVADTMHVEIGGRYQSVHKNGALSPTLALLGPGDTAYGTRGSFGAPVAGRVKTSDFLPELGLSWEVAPSTMVYAKYAQAFKAGGFVMSPAIQGVLPDPFTYKPEVAEGVELGFKGLLADGRLSLNAALYDTDYSDLQVVVIEPSTATFVTTNAAESHTTGIELDARWVINEHLAIDINGAFGEAKYDRYVGAECNALDAKRSQVDPCVLDLSGESLVLAPDWSIGFRPELNFRLGPSLRARINVFLMASDGYVLSNDRDPIHRVDPWQRLDVRLGLSDADGRWELALYGRNVTGEDIKIGGPANFQSKSLDLVHDAGGTALQRDARYGVQFLYFFDG